MKCTNFILVFILIAFRLAASETVSVRFANPHLEYLAPDNFLVFDVQMKCTSGATYLYSSQVICSIDLASINTSIPPVFVKAACGGIFLVPPSGPSYDRYSITANWNNSTLNIAILHTFEIDSYHPASYLQLTTAWQTLGTVRIALNGTADAGVAGINFIYGAMDGFQKYALSPTSTYYYLSPNNYEGPGMQDLYLGRIFSGTSGWTQWNGTLNWQIAVNTSVWDISGSTASISGAGSRSAALRIHSGAMLEVLSGVDLTTSGMVDISGPLGLVVKPDGIIHLQAP